jgi:hypothetical protein
LKTGGLDESSPYIPRKISLASFLLFQLFSPIKQVGLMNQAPTNKGHP